MKRYLMALMFTILVSLSIIDEQSAFAQASAPISASQAVQQDEDSTEFSNIHLHGWTKVIISIIATIICIRMWYHNVDDE